MGGAAGVAGCAVVVEVPEPRLGDVAGVMFGVVPVAIGGVVPGVVDGVVPGVVVGVVPGVVVGVVPGVVEGVPIVPGVVPKAPVPVAGGQIELVDAPAVVPGDVVPGELAVPVELGVVPLDVVPTEGVITPVDIGQVLLRIGLVLIEVGEGRVPEAPGAAVGDWLIVAGIVGVVPWTEEFPVAVPGAVVPGIAGVVAPAPVDCAAAMPTHRHTAAVSESTRVIMRIFLLIALGMASERVMDAMDRELPQARRSRCECGRIQHYPR